MVRAKIVRGKNTSDIAENAFNEVSLYICHLYTQKVLIHTKSVEKV